MAIHRAPCAFCPAAIQAQTSTNAQAEGHARGRRRSGGARSCPWLGKVARLACISPEKQETMESYAHRMEIKALLTLLTDTRIVPRGGRRRRPCLARGATWHIAGETTGGWRGALGRRFALFDDRRQYDTEPCRAVCSAFFPFQQLIAWGWRTLCPWRLAWWPRRRLPSGPRWRGSWRCPARLGRSCIAIELHERPPCHFDAFL